MVVPVLIVMLFNGLALGGIFKAISKKSLRYREEYRPLRARFRIVFGFTIIFSLSWVFGILVLVQDRIELQYLFCLVNVGQGFYIFILYCARQSKVRKYWFQLIHGKSIKDIKRKSFCNKIGISNHHRISPYSPSSKSSPGTTASSSRMSVISVLSS